MGAYASSGETIYLNQDWLATASEEDALAVLMEELGHHLDNVVKERDTLGDEGAIFASPLEGSLAIDLGDNSVLPADTQDIDGDGDVEEPLPFDQRGLNRVVAV